MQVWPKDSSAGLRSKDKRKAIPLQARCGPEDGYSYSSTVP